MSARGLAAGEHHAHAHGFFAGGGIGAFYKGDFRQSVRVGKNPFDGGLVGDAFGGLAGFRFDGSGAFFKDVGQHGLELAAVPLKLGTIAFRGAFDGHCFLL